MEIVLASGSSTRAALFRAAGLAFRMATPRIDEQAIKASLSAEGASPRAIADAIAEAKARKVGPRHAGAITFGSDQVLDLDGEMLSKPADPAAARAQIARLCGRRHRLHCAVVAYEETRPVWRHLATARLTMRRLSEGCIADYVGRNWPAIGGSVGSYRLEDEGMRLFTAIEGDFFAIQGLPMLPLLSWLIDRGDLPA